MSTRPLPKEAIREGHRARTGGIARDRNPYDRSIPLTRTNRPEFNAATRLRDAWFSGWDSADTELQTRPGGQ